MSRINKKHVTSAIMLAVFIALLLMQMVRADPMTISIAPAGGPVGTNVMVSGFADTPGGTINIYYDIDGDGLIEPEEFMKSTTAGINTPYLYTDTIIVPPSHAGTHAITATDVTAARSAGDYFTVTPQISVSPDVGPIGTIVTVTGTGFARTSPITIMFGDEDVTPSPAPVTNQVGSFTADFSVPPLVEGDYTVKATDAAGNFGTDVFSLIGIMVTIDPTSGPVGTLVTVSGTQATPDGLVTIWWDSVAVDSVSAQGDGTYSYDLTVPPSSVGDHTVKAEDVESTNTATKTFTVEPQIILSVSEGPVDTELTVTGTGFVANAYVDITYDTPLVVENFETDSVGGFVATFNVPASVAGVHTVTATDTIDLTITASAQFTVIPKITIDVTEGPIGTEVEVTGTGFAEMSTITLTFNGIDVTPALAPETDEYGSFTASFETPPAPARDYTITATDENDNEATATFTLWGITISIAPANGPVGTIVSVTGTYATPEGSIAIRWDGIDVATITAEPDGTYSYDLTVPPSVTGEHTVTVEDVESTNTVAETFTVEPQIILTPEDGLVGDSVTVTGTGFSGVSVVDVYFDIDKDGLPDAEELMLDNVPTDEFGSFEASFNVPWVSTAGNYLITAVDGEGVTDDATFTVLFVMYTRSDEYFQGDYPSFFIQAVNEAGEPLEGATVIIEAFDPKGYIQYKGVTITVEGGTVPYDMQFFNWWIWNYAETFEPSALHLPSDALTGTWQWTATVEGLTVNGSFEVIEPVDLRTLLQKLDQLLDGQNDIAELIAYYGDKLQLEHDQLAELIATASDNLQMDHEELMALINNVAEKLQMEHEDIAALVAEVLNDLGIKLDDISDQITGIEDKADGLYLVIGELEVKLDDIGTTLISIQDGMATITTTLGSIEVKLDDIQAKLTAVQGDIATINTSLGQIQVDLEDINAEIVEIKDSMATIKTDVGTIQVKLDDIEAKLVDIQADLAVITTTLGEIETKVDNLGAVSLEEIKGDIATIKSDIGTIKVNVNNINADITSIKGRLVTIETTVGTIQEDIDNINGKIVALEGDTATIQTDIGTVKTNLSDINAKIEVTNDNVATIQTDVGTIKGRLTSVEGCMATIQTDIGTVKTTTSNIETTGESIKSDTNLQFPTVALSLIAAIGAIAAVAMILRKVYVK